MSVKRKTHKRKRPFVCAGVVVDPLIGPTGSSYTSDGQSMGYYIRWDLDKRLGGPGGSRQWVGSAKRAREVILGVQLSGGRR